MKGFLPLAVVIALTAQESKFGVQSRLVLVPVTVSDARGHTIDGLETKDFVVLDNGRPQNVTVDTMATGVAPIALVIAIQTSDISKAVIEKVNKVGATLQPLVTGERGCAAVVSFSERIVWQQECTNSAGALAQAFSRLLPGSGRNGRLLDAVAESIDRLRQHPNSRKVLLLISETRDCGSETALDAVAADAQTDGVTIYAATYSAFRTAFTTKSSAIAEPQAPKVPKTPSEQTGTMDGGPPHCGPAGCPNPQVPGPDQRVDVQGGIGELIRMGKTNTTQALAKGTGGALFPFTRLSGLEDAIRKLGAELHSQYILSFRPDDPAPGYHNLEVRVTTVDSRVRARLGYWSSARTVGK